MPSVIDLRKSPEKTKEPEVLQGATPQETETETISLSWEAPDASLNSRNAAILRISGSIFIVGAIIAAIFKNYPFAVLLLISGCLTIAQSYRTPRVVTFRISGNGIDIGNRRYAYDALQSFWIFYDPPHRSDLVILSKRTLMPGISIPLGDTDPLHVRKILLPFLREEKREESVVDVLAKTLGF